MTYPHVHIVCKDCMVYGYLYEMIKGKTTLEDMMKILEKFRLYHFGHNILIADYNNYWFETNCERLKDITGE